MAEKSAEQLRVDSGGELLEAPGDADDDEGSEVGPKPMVCVLEDACRYICNAIPPESVEAPISLTRALA